MAEAFVGLQLATSTLKKPKLLSTMKRLRRGCAYSPLTKPRVNFLTEMAVT